MLRPLLSNWPLTSWGLLPLPLIDIAAGLLPPLRGTRFERVDFDDGCPAEWTHAEGARDDGVVLYFHGGAFLACGLATHRREVTRISAASGLPVLSVGYRQLPQVGLTGSVADCFAAYRWLLEQGFDPDRIILAGDSAGGHLAFSTALAARDAGLPLPAGIVALSPWLDLDATSKQAHPNAERDAFAPVDRLPTLTRLLVQDAELDRDLSPVNADLTGLPPTLIMTAESEMLRCDAELMADRLSAADVPCELQVWHGQVHAFPVLGNLLPESRAAIVEIGRFVRDVLANATTTGRGEADVELAG
jgi:acetyl esterase/lipase